MIYKKGDIVPDSVAELSDRKCKYKVRFGCEVDVRENCVVALEAGSVICVEGDVRRLMRNGTKKRVSLALKKNLIEVACYDGDGGATFNAHYSSSPSNPWVMET